MDIKNGASAPPATSITNQENNTESHKNQPK
jgi:hypothetical protein